MDYVKERRIRKKRGEKDNTVQLVCVFSVYAMKCNAMYYYVYKIGFGCLHGVSEDVHIYIYIVYI